MALFTSASRDSRKVRGRAFRIAAILASVGLLVAACGTNSSTTAPAASGAPAASSAPAASLSGSAAAPASQAPAVSAAAVSGTLTVWAMGNEGVKLKDMADKFMAANPGTTVNVTPVDWGQAVAKLQTAIAGHQTPDVSQMGTDMMGQFGATGAFEAVPVELPPGARSSRAPGTPTSSTGPSYGVPWYVETRLLYYRTDIAQKAGITTPPATWDDLTAMAKAMQSKGGAKYGIALGTKNWQEYFPFLWSNGGDIMDASGKFTLNSPQAVEALTFYKSFFNDGLLPEVGPRRLRHHAGIRRGHAPDVLLRPVAPGPHQDGRRGRRSTANGRSRRCPGRPPRPRSSAAATSSSTRTARTRIWPGSSSSTCRDPKTQVAWYTDATDLPAVQAGVGRPRRSRATRTSRCSASSSRTRKAQPAISDLERDRDRDQRDAREDDDRQPDPAGGRRRDAAGGREDRDGQLT